MLQGRTTGVKSNPPTHEAAIRVFPSSADSRCDTGRQRALLAIKSHQQHVAWGFKPTFHLPSWAGNVVSSSLQQEKSVA